MTVVHKPSEGAEYLSGIKGQRIGIIGYSHWNGDPNRADHEKFTLGVIGEVSSGGRLNFFTSISGYFGHPEPAHFWSKVLFFNYLPRCIGGPDNRFDVADESWSDSANERFRDILGKYAPDKVIVFTSKGWGSLPPFDDSLNHEFDSKDLAGAVLRDCCGIYRANSRSVMAFGLRHPQGAPAETMYRAVQRILDIPLIAN